MIKFNMMMTIRVCSTLLLSSFTSAALSVGLSLTPPDNASEPLLQSFVSFAIEFSSFPDFAGTSDDPNSFSYNLLSNIRDLQGSYPIVRVGGNSQDYAIFDPSQQQNIVGIINDQINRDYPTTVTIGPSFFDSYLTWPDVPCIHGFNLAKNGSMGLDGLRATVPLMCKALPGDKLAYFQLGNEPDLYKTGQIIVRPPSWDEADYVDEWLNKTGIIRQLVQENCPEVIQQGRFEFYAPSFGSTSFSLNMIKTWQAGLNNDNNIAFIDSHFYVGGAQQPGVTLQGTLMNHTSTILAVNKHLVEITDLRKYTNLPYVLGEANSLSNAGAPGISNTFGAALWTVDFNLYCAASGISRVHMQQGTNFRYNAWSPIETTSTTKGTKAPYYGSIMVAAMLGDLTQDQVRISNIDIGNDHNTVYAAYVNGTLARIAVVQMRAYKHTDLSLYRPHETFTFQLPSNSGVKTIGVQRLIAPGSNSITGVTFDGISYNWELDNGKPVVLQNVTRGITVPVNDEGIFSVNVPWSSAAILHIGS